jgi:hypothetical protein
LDAQLGRLPMFYQWTTLTLASLVILASPDHTGAVTASAVTLLVFFGTHAGNLFLHHIGWWQFYPAKEGKLPVHPDLGIKYHQRVAIVALVLFAMTGLLDRMITVVQASSPAKTISPIQKTVDPVKSPVRTNGRNIA